MCHVTVTWGSIYIELEDIIICSVASESWELEKKLNTEIGVKVMTFVETMGLQAINWQRITSRASCTTKRLCTEY